MQILKDEIRNRILDVAQDMFYRNGFKDTTTRSIAQGVGISVSNLYLYYENKEAIFHAVTDGFFSYFTSAFTAFLDHKNESHVSETDVSRAFQEIIMADQRKFMIIMDKSQGTKYEGFKKKIIDILGAHILSQWNRELIRDELLAYILAKNLIEGIVEIARNYTEDNSLERRIGVLISYHMQGMKPLL